MLNQTLALLITLAAIPAQSPPAAPHECGVDLQRVGQMEDVLSNALTRGLEFKESRVRPYLESTRKDCSSGDQLLQRAALDFKLDPQRLAQEVERFRHVNCGLEPAQAPRAEPSIHLPLSTFAEDVALHVVLHELGHALIREFDLPVLANEEATADAFATHFLTSYMPERALAVLRARVASLEYEAQQIPRAEWSVVGEHDSDARRARQIAALAIAADPQKYQTVADIVALSEADRRRAADYGAEIHRSWRRILRPLWMPGEQPSAEVGTQWNGESELIRELRASRLPGEIEAALRRFDWHSRVELHFVDGPGKASWSRSKRAITVHSGYLQRFIAQGQALTAPK
jgi:Putative metallopeptidase